MIARMNLPHDRKNYERLMDESLPRLKAQDTSDIVASSCSRKIAAWSCSGEILLAWIRNIQKGYF